MSYYKGDLIALAVGVVIVALVYFTSTVARADTLNPCEYMNINAEQANKLDVGDDPNWTRIVQQKNRDMIRACLDYQQKALEERTNDLNRDNF